MEQQKKTTILDLPALAMAEVYSFLTFKELSNAMLTCNYFRASSKHYFASLFHNWSWDLLAEKTAKPGTQLKAHKQFLEIVRMKYVRLAASVPFNPVDTSSLVPEFVHPIPHFTCKGVLYVRFTYDFSAAPAQSLPSAFCLTYGGQILQYKLVKSVTEEHGQLWQYVSTVSIPRFVQIECSKSMCGLGTDGKAYDVLPISTGFSSAIEVPHIEGEVKQVGCTVLHHFALTKENIVYYWNPDDYVLHTVECPKKEIVQISCESNFAYLLCADYEVYVIDEQEQEKETAAAGGEARPKVAHLVPELSKLRLKKISSGIVHSLAMSQEDVPSIKEWGTNELVQWVEKNGFEDYANVIKYKKITGKDIDVADDKYLVDVVGLVDENLLQKFSTERTRLKVPTVGRTVLYGWGTNHHGELASKANSCKYNNPTMLPVPDFPQNEYIKSIVCGFKTSALITSSGSLWVAGNVQALKKPPEVKKEARKKSKKEKKRGAGKGGEDELPEEELFEGPPVKEKKERLEKKEKLEQYQQKLHIDKTLKHRWVNIDYLLDPDMAVNVKSITMSNRENVICYSVTKCRRDGKLVGKKFKGVDKILDQIEWDDRLKASTFVIGYDDRFLGVMEMAHKDFLVSDVPLHRIQYIKRDGVVAWDRKTRLDKLS